MLKLFSLLFALSPIASAIAQASENNLSNDTSKNKNELATTQPTAKNKAITLAEKSMPRDVQVFFKQCYQNVPPVVINPNNRAKNTVPVDIEANSLRGLGGEIIYQGDVSLVQGLKTLNADSMTYNRHTEQANAVGNAHYVDGQITLNADRIETNLNTDESNIYQTQYQFHGQSGRGDADKVHDNGKDLYELKSSSYTACPPNDTTWTLDSSTLYIDNVEEMGSAYNAVLKIKDVPVFYFPYVSYPLTDKRKTGLLFPSYEMSSVNGFTIRQPLYLNIAPNQDATITPTYMQERGLLVATEYRYLFDVGSGKIQAEYLNADKLRDDEDRYLIHFDHNVSFATNWHFSADYNSVSDDYYFSDIDTDYGTRSDNQLLQTAKLQYVEVNWNSELEVRDFQILGGGETPHIVMPKLAASFYKPLPWRSLQFDWYSEITKFTHDDDNVYTGTRIHMQPTLSLPLYYDSIFINTELKYMLTFYQQNLENATKYSWYNDLAESASRYLPSFKIHSGINLERDFTLFGQSYRQTLVPQVQYLYVPYQNQSDIGLYDTTTLQQDYYGLFRDNRYSGYDRIADANQITIGLSSSFLNAQGKEKLRFAVGQNYYIEESRTTLPTDEKTEQEKMSRSSIIGEFDVNFENDYFLHAGLEWDNDNNVIKRANTTLEKRWAYNTYLQLSYRYYKQPDDAVWNQVVNQLGSKINWSINTQWTTFASYYYDVEFENTFESIVGIKYQSCCWAVGLTFDQHMLPYYGSESAIGTTVETEQSVSFTFELMGLGGVGYSSGEQGLFDYGRPFYLK